jgi:hypothetical protein
VRIIVFILLASVVVHAQGGPNLGPTDFFAWNQAAPTLNDANSYVYKYYLDGAVTGSVFLTVTCTGTAAPFDCKGKPPAFAPGSHSLTITAANSSGESPQSTPFGFVYGNPPVSPNNIRIEKGP